MERPLRRSALRTMKFEYVLILSSVFPLDRTEAEREKGAFEMLRLMLVANNRKATSNNNSRDFREFCEGVKRGFYNGWSGIDMPKDIMMVHERIMDARNGGLDDTHRFMGILDSEGRQWYMDESGSLRTEPTDTPATFTSIVTRFSPVDVPFTKEYSRKTLNRYLSEMLYPQPSMRMEEAIANAYNWIRKVDYGFDDEPDVYAVVKPKIKTDVFIPFGNRDQKHSGNRVAVLGHVPLLDSIREPPYIRQGLRKGLFDLDYFGNVRVTEEFVRDLFRSGAVVIFGMTSHNTFDIAMKVIDEMTSEGMSPVYRFVDDAEGPMNVDFDDMEQFIQIVSSIVNKHVE